MSGEITALVERALARAPQWIRHDLPSPDPAVRTRAEEALAAIIAAALKDEPDPAARR